MKANDFEGRRNISGERVRMRRLRLRLSQAALAAKVDQHFTVVNRALSRIESGTRMVQDYELWALAEVLGVTSDWLLTGEDDGK